MPSKDESIVIIGAGVFGLSTALELRKRGYRHVTVLDRYMPPVADGSSVDISRVIRVEYADPLYGQMARDALEGWQTEYSGHFYTSGFYMLGSPGQDSYIEKAKQADSEIGSSLKEYSDANTIRNDYPGVQARLGGLRGYLNPKGGWADAASSIQQLATTCSKAGVSFVVGPRGTAQALQYKDGRVIGVHVAAGTAVPAGRVILATGAWSNRLLEMSHVSSASGQPVGFIQLTPEEARRVAKMPVMINLDTGVFVFPPFPNTNVLKVARHGHGYGTEVPVAGDLGGRERLVSSPKRDGSNAESGYLPSDADIGLREGLRQFLPDFASRPWMDRRLCWYSDTPEGDFVVDRHPTISGLFLATGGAGHAFKFLPVLGKYIADCYEDKASQELRHKWRFRQRDGHEDENLKAGDGSRAGPAYRVLTPTEQAKL